MTDIAALINKLNYWRGYQAFSPSGWLDLRVDLGKAADALSRLAASYPKAPLPEEITGLIERLLKHRAYSPIIDEAVTAIRTQAQQVAGLNAIHQTLEERLRALAQENERLKQPYTPLGLAHRLQKRIRELEAERDPIKLKTIEECAAIAEACGDILTAEELAIEIRALAHSERGEGKEES